MKSHGISSRLLSARVARCRDDHDRTNPKDRLISFSQCIFENKSTKQETGGKHFYLEKKESCVYKIKQEEGTAKEKGKKKHG